MSNIKLATTTKDVNYPSKEITLDTVSEWLFTPTDVHKSFKPYKGINLSLTTICRLRNLYPAIVGPSSDKRYSYAYTRRKVEGGYIKDRTPVYYFTFVDVCMLAWFQSLKGRGLYIRDEVLVDSGKMVRTMLERYLENPDMEPVDTRVDITWCPLSVTCVYVYASDLAYVIMKAVSRVGE